MGLEKTLLTHDSQISLAQSKQEGSQHDGSKPRINLWLVFAIIGCLLFAASYSSHLLERARVRGEVVALQQRVERSTQRNAELQAERAYVNSDTYVEDVARSQLNLTKPGDTVIVVPAAQAVEADGIEQKEEQPIVERPIAIAPTALPYWRQWLSLFIQDNN